MKAGTAQFRRMTATARMSRVDVVSADLILINLKADEINGEIIPGQALDKLAVTESSKADIKAAIEAYSVPVGAIALADYDGKIALIGASVESTIKSGLEVVNEESGGATIADDIALVDSNYQAIKASIVAKGVNMTGIKPSGYDDKIPLIGDNYTRPSFWPELPAVTVDGNGEPTEQVIYMLAAVFADTIYNPVTVTVRGATTITWGDGNTDNVADNTKITHIYSPADLVATTNERGYKTVIITIRPQAGQSITLVDTYDSLGNPNNILEVRAAMLLTGATSRLRYLPMCEIVEFVGSGVWSFFGSNTGLIANNLKKFTINLKDATEGRDILRNGFMTVNSFNADLSKALYVGFSFSSAGLFINQLTLAMNAVSAWDGTSFLNGSAGIKRLTLDNASKCSTLTNAFLNCRLLSLRMPLVNVAFSVASNSLDAAALNALFVDLADRTSLTPLAITITGNPGAATCNQTIATAKKWTVTN